jgi:hypothetical protein
VLAATAAELLQLQPFRHRLPVLGLRIVPLFAITALHGNDLSGHTPLLNSAVSIQPSALSQTVVILRRVFCAEGSLHFFSLYQPAET